MKSRWYKNAIIYQIYPLSFMDSNDDGYGDINGIISKLDYIKDLGVTAIWFSPLYKSPFKDYGYDIEDYLSINEVFGSMEDFKRLIDECHKRGLKVIMDAVFNHTSDKHIWFKKALEDPLSPYRDYYIFRKGIRKGNKLLPPNNWTSSFTGSAWERVEGTDEFYLHLFTKEQPDLNWENEKVRKEVINIFNTYFEMGVDGFRMDVFNVFSKVEGLPNTKHKAIASGGMEYFVDGPRMHEFLHELFEKSFSKYDTYTVGESYQSNEDECAKYVDERNEEIDSLFNFSHLQADCIAFPFITVPFNMMKFKKGLIDPQIKDYLNGCHTLVLENHDVPRSISRFGLKSKLYRKEIAKMLATVTFMGYGIPFIYEGEEIGTDNHPFSSIDECMDPVSHFIHRILKKLPISEKLRMRMISNGARDNARRPMQWDSTVNGGFTKGTPWQKVNPDYETINVENDLSSSDSVYRYYQKLLELKKTNNAAISGDIREYDRKNRSVIAYSRSYKDDQLLIVGNFKDKDVLFRVPEELSDYIFEPILSNYEDAERVDMTIELKPYQTIIFSLKLNEGVKKEYSYGAVTYRVVNNKVEYLVEEMGLGHKSLPKGHIEDGETIDDCVKREIKEELSLDIELDKYFKETITYKPSDDVIKDVTFFIALATDFDVEIDNKEVIGYKWLKYSKAKHYLTHASDKIVLDKANIYLKRKLSK